MGNNTCIIGYAISGRNLYADSCLHKEYECDLSILIGNLRSSGDHQVSLVKL